MVVRLVLGLLLTVVAAAVAGQRLWWLFRLFRAGQPAVGRTDDWPKRLGAQVTEVFGQRKLLQWSIPGIAHFVTFWGFIVLLLTIIEAYGGLFKKDFAIPLIGTWPVIGFLEDFFSVAIVLALATFTVIRFQQQPKNLGRASRFYKSHTGAAWFVLFMIFNVVWTLLLMRGAQVNTGVFPYKSGAFASYAVGALLHPLGLGVNEVLETVGLLLQLGVVLGFGVFVVYSKHMHIALAPPNILFSRRPRALGALLPMYSNGKAINFEDPGDDDLFGRGAIEHTTWKGMLDFATCTECGRCQSQCPAWNTGKPLSPKLLITDQRDHLFAKAPYLLAGGGVSAAGDEKLSDEKLAALPESVRNEVERSLVGKVEEGGVIDPDVLWSCTTCGACVEQCPVDIEHVDHIVDMRRYQVLIESAFPSEAGVMLKNLENKGNPWGQNPNEREDWTKGLDFEVRRVEGAIPDDVEYLFWVGCAGALEDRAKKVTRAVAELLHTAGVEFAILGNGETCTGDPARRMGNEFIFQMLGQQNVETLNEAFGERTVEKRKIVATCAHCFNTLGNEYGQLGGDYDVVHHTQLLSQLVADGKLTPVTPLETTLTYHDPCYLGRHNRVFTPPREVLQGLPGTTYKEMPRFAERSFCCGAGGARMWMEEKIGQRVNVNRTEEALSLKPDVIAIGCPFCLTMISDGVTEKQAGGEGDGVEVLDVSQVLLRTIKPAKAKASD
jgi:Fe-S oxidoreductase